MKKQRWGFLSVCTLCFAVAMTGLFLFRAMGPGVSTDRRPDAQQTAPEQFREPRYPLDINTATEEELAFLPGIGPVTARAIVAHRQSRGPFGSIEELTEVSGIGEAKLRQILPYITTGG